MSLLEILTLSCLPTFLLIDLLHRANPRKRVAWWRTRAAGVTTLSYAISLVVAAAWSHVFQGVSLFKSTEALGTIASVAAAVLVYELFHYTYHRSAHTFRWLWRVHQVHHSAETLDAWGAYYLHPVDVIFFTTGSNLVLFPLMGLSVEAGLIATAVITFFGIFQHADIRTPHWLGYLVQRPESHGVHHARDVHQRNYADLPLWDIVFGTFTNPRDSAQPQQGFYFGASTRLVDGLLLKDITQPADLNSRAGVSAPLTAAKAD